MEIADSVSCRIRVTTKTANHRKRRVEKKTLLANQLPEGRGPVIEPQMTENENEKWSGPNAVPRHGGPFTSNYRS
jgi:hypothetical protein